jgi:cytochrome c biogenesis protein CcmG/thiol:disulfide interchange protein DsbE
MALRPLILLPPAIFAALAGLFLGGMWRDDPAELPSTLEGREVPPVVLTALEGDPFTDADLRSPGVKLVNYWASWCAPCRVEHPMLMEIAETVPVYGINYKDEPGNALGFLAELGNPFASLGADPTGRMAIDWGVYGVPETYVIDGDGVVRLRFAGPITRDIYEKRIRPAIEAAAAD